MIFMGAVVSRLILGRGMPGGCRAGCSAVWLTDQALSDILQMQFGQGKMALEPPSMHKTLEQD
jgi:hypothetical protein